MVGGRISKVHKNQPNYWKKIAHQQEFLALLFAKFNFRDFEEFKYISKRKIEKNGGIQLSRYYPTISQLLMTVYPNYPWKFRHQKIKRNKRKENKEAENKEKEQTKTEKDYNLQRKEKTKDKKYWKSLDNQRNFVKFMEEKLNIKEDKTEWVKFKNFSKIEILGGKDLLFFYNSDLHNLFAHIYPANDWQILQIKLPKYRKLMQIKSDLLQIQRENDIRKREDWYRVELSESPKLLRWLKIIHAEEEFEAKLFQVRTKKAIQRLIYHKLTEIYENKILIIEDYDHPMIKSKSSDLDLELDLYLPSYNIAIEYQGEQHYDDMCANGFSQIEFYRSRDFTKSHLCQSLQISLFVIPYWWNRRSESLQSILLT